MKGLGKRIQTLRKEKQLTLVDVAQRTGIDQATLSRIENGKMTGTLHSHMKIADVLQIPLPSLYENMLSEVDKAQERTAELLASGILRKKMLPTILELKAKGRTAKEIYSAQSERFLYVLKGAVEITLAAEKQILKEGHSLYFDASKPHYLRNVTRSESRCLSVLTPHSL